jgi:threonine synthase
VKYVSTRGAAPVLGFDDVLLTGLAVDGGLYVPERWPALPADVGGRPYAEVAAEVLWPFADGALDRAELEAVVGEAYATFDHPEVCPVRPLTDDGIWLLELFHGPTLAFKDVALQVVGRLFDRELARRDERVTIVVATSGDTGSAAIEACRGREHIDIVVLHPHGRVSEVQRRQMTTVGDANVHNIAVEGTFDDCQALVKDMFADTAFRHRARLSAMNSINWARLAPQIVYYATAAAAVAGPGRTVAFAVPTGNFGNVYAAYAAHRMGLPVTQLVVGSNRNDILTRFLDSGHMQVAEVVPTLSPSMDIQVSSNFERLLFEAHDRRASVVAEAMAGFKETGALTLDGERLARLRSLFDGAAFDDDATLAEIARTWEEHGVLVDPHTAVGLAAARRLRRDPDVPLVVAATAHPAKFPDAVEQATGVRPPLPPHLDDVLERAEHVDVVAADLAAIEDLVAARIPWMP